MALNTGDSCYVPSGEKMSKMGTYNNCHFYVKSVTELFDAEPIIFIKSLISLEKI